ncbi:MAG: molybdenum cofactor guanylyltransferase MobA [Candidatus Parabeggiatoa sp.]|nr:molybdenum cofactor guanylyltransferase MobA [Candidatus Parabeggiatoa sp.]
MDDFLNHKDKLTGVILAGGRATRMGGLDKGLILLNNKPMVEYVIAALRPQVGQLLISANRHLEHYAQLGDCPVFGDTFGHYDGPLAGMATALAKAETDYILFVPCDCPRLSPEIAKRLYTGLRQSDAEASVAYDGQRIHPIFSLLKRRLLNELLSYLESGERSIQGFLRLTQLIEVDFSDSLDTFLNINTHEALSMEFSSTFQL